MARPKKSTPKKTDPATPAPEATPEVNETPKSTTKPVKGPKDRKGFAKDIAGITKAMAASSDPVVRNIGKQIDYYGRKL